MHSDSSRIVMALALATAAALGCGGLPPDGLVSTTHSEDDPLERKGLCDECVRSVRPVIEADFSSARGWLSTSQSQVHPAVDARPRSEIEWWTAEHQRINAEVQQNRDARLLFIGDSITWAWKLWGSAVWEHHYSERRPLNLGIPGDQTQHVLWRLQNGNLAGLDPRTVVLLIGVNNALDETHQPAHIAAGVAAILAEIHRQMPRTRVLLLAILPAGPHPGSFRDKLSATNRLLAELGGGQVTFLDIGPQFLDDAGDLTADIAFDYLHLTELGYKIWGHGMEFTLREMLLDRGAGSNW